MPVKVKVHDNNSSVRVRINDNDSSVNIRPNADMDIERFYSLLDHEKEERIAGDEALQQEIDDINADLDELGDLAKSDTATGSTTLSTIDSLEFIGSADVNAIYTPKGEISKPAINITSSKATVEVKNSDGNVNEGSSASFTSGSFSGGSFTQGADLFNAPSLSLSVDENEVLTIGFSAGSFTQGQDSFTAATHGADTFKTNTPTQVTLPTFKEQTVMTNASAELNNAPTFTGTQETIRALGPVGGEIAVERSDKTVTITVTGD